MTKVFKIFTCLCLFFACQETNKQTYNLDFDGKEIMTLVEKQLSFGKRVNNSTAKEKCVQWIVEIAKQYGYSVELDNWKENVKGAERNFTNIIATKKGSLDNGDFIIAGSHYDTKYIPSQVNFLGANDGASSTAALLAVMKKLQKWENKKALRFIFFDGEECFGGNNDYKRIHEGSLNGLHGSSRYAQKLLYDNTLKNCHAMLLMDMIGDKNLNIEFPYNNSPKLIDFTLNLVKEEKLEKYFSKSNKIILDDHLPFEELGVATINFIDFNYGENNQFWHTNEDTLDKLSPDSLAITTHIFTKLLKSLAQ